MDDSHRMGASGKLRGTPDEIEGLLVEAIGLTVDHYRHNSEIPPALITYIKALPYKVKGYFTPNTC